MPDLNILLAFMIVGAIIAVEVESLLSAIVSVGAVGLALSITFLALKAPDLAIVQLVVEILALLLLLRATIGSDVEQEAYRRSLLQTCFALLFIAVFLGLGWSCLRGLPQFGAPLMKVSEWYVNHAREKTGAVNVVAAIILDFRGYDTLGEATVLFTAVIGTLAVLRRIGRKK